MTPVYLSLGSNQGDRLTYLREAVRALDQSEGIRVVSLSSVYETAPVGFEAQPAFLNLVAVVGSTLEPLDLLLACQVVENALGRKRELRWGPRTVDIDVLIYGDQKIDHPQLQVPHPRMKERAFVLVPLIEVAPRLAIDGLTPTDLLERVPGRAEQSVIRWGGTEDWLHQE